MIKVAVIGTFPPLLTGQSIMTEEVFQIIGKRGVKIETARYGLRDVRSLLYCLVRVTLLIGKVNTIYFTPSRSVFGSFRDSIIIVMGKIMNVRLIAHLHGLDFDRLLSDHGLWSKILVKVYSNVEFIVLFNGMEGQLKRIVNPKYYVISNCSSEVEKSIDIGDMSEDNIVQVTYLSNIMTSKGIFEFLDLAEGLLDLGDYVRIKIAGAIMSDEEASFTQTKTRFSTKLNSLKLRFNDRIEYLGQVKGNAKMNLLKDTKVLLFPSRYPMEAQPLVLVEALFFGVQIVFRNHNFLKEQFESKGNYCYNTLDAVDLYNIIKMSDYEKIANDNRILAQSEFSHRKFKDSILNILLNG